MFDQPRALLRVYDFGDTSDRYTVVLKRRGYDLPYPLYPCLGLSGAPEHPQGVSQFGDCKLGRHLGKRIAWGDLPENVQAHVAGRIEATEGGQ